MMTSRWFRKQWLIAIIIIVGTIALFSWIHIINLFNQSLPSTDIIMNNDNNNNNIITSLELTLSPTIVVPQPSILFENLDQLKKYDENNKIINYCTSPKQIENGIWMKSTQPGYGMSKYNFNCCGQGCSIQHLAIHGKGCECQSRPLERPPPKIKNYPVPANININITTLSPTKSSLPWYPPFSTLLDWEWIPSTCILPSFSPHSFCKLIPPTKTILFSGDSLTRQMFGALSSVLYHGSENCWKQFAFQDSDTLIGLKLGSGVHNRGIALNKTIGGWLNGFRNFTVNAIHNEANSHRQISDLLIVTQAGAHIQGTDVEMAKSRAAMVANQIIEWKKEFNIDMIWVMQLFGHSTCVENAIPYVTDKQVIDSFGRHDRYHHAWYFDKNYIMTDLLSAANIPIVNSTALRFRPDSHPHVGDCLHQCIPGPLTQLFPILFQMVLENGIKDGRIRSWWWWRK
jgi:hypothetical protein